LQDNFTLRYFAETKLNMELKEIDLALILRAKKDRGLRAKICYDLNKHDSTVYRWLNGDFANLPPAAYELIKKWFKNK